MHLMMNEMMFGNLTICILFSSNSLMFVLLLFFLLNSAPACLAQHTFTQRGLWDGKRLLVNSVDALRCSGSLGILPHEDDTWSWSWS